MASKDRQNAELERRLVTAEMEIDSFAGIGDVVDNQQAFGFSSEEVASGSERRRGSDSVWGGKP